MFGRYDRTNNPFVVALILLVSTGFLIAAVWAGLNTLALLRAGVRTTGMVVGPIEAPDRGMSGAHPAIAFRTREGEAVTYSQNGMGGRRIGTRLPVLYRPSDPQAAVVPDFLRLWGEALAFLWIGGGFPVLLLLGAKFELNTGKRSGPS